MDVESLAKQLILQNMTPEQQNAVLESVRSSLLEARNNQKRRVSENVGMVVEALKKIEADIRAKYDDLGGKIETRVNSIKDGRDGIDGRDGKDGKDGRPGRDGAAGPMGPAGRDGINGLDGEDGVSVTDAKIDFDGSLVITLSNGREINVGEVVAPDLAERIKVITNGGGTSQAVLDALASLQAQIDALVVLDYKGTWNASTNTPTLASGVGDPGSYYIVSVAGSTNLDGITDWQPGDWLIFNGTVWQKIDQSWATAGANNNITSMTGITGGISSPDFIQFDTGATVTNAAGRLYWDSTQQTLTVGLNANIAADVGQTLYAYATNDEAVTINKGQPVYMFAAQGDRVSVKLAYNTGDATSAKTLGICAENIAAGQAGMILCQGVQDGLDMSAYNPGDTLYLGATAGSLTSTKPYAPNHLVYIGVVERANAGNGRLYVRVQNGYEMDELHNVSAQNPTNGQVLIYNESTGLWTKNTLTAGTAIGVTNGAGSITINNTGVTSAVAGTGISVSGATGAVTITNSAPDQTVSLTGAGTTSISGTYPNFTITSNDQYTGTVTSVSGTGTVNGLSLSGTVTSSGSLTLGGTLTGTASLNINGTVGATTPNSGAFTTLSASSTVSGTGFSTYLASPPAIGGTAAAAGSFTTLSATGVTTVQAGTVSAPAITTSGDTNTGIFFPAADTVAIGTGGTEALRVNSSQNVGIGTSSPTAKIDVAPSSGAASIYNRAVAGQNATFDLAGGGNTVGSTSFQLSQLSDSSAYVFQRANSALVFGTNNTERARIDSNGNVMTGATSATFAGYTFKFSVTEGSTYTPMGINSNAAGTASTNVIIFARNGTQAGAITITGTTATYGSGSDYRLKNDVAPLNNALAKVSLLKPVSWKWKIDDSYGEGFIAHELAEVCPQAVIGQKDEVNAEGDPVYQSVDTSFLVATLTAAIQELKTELDATKAEIAALKAQP